MTRCTWLAWTFGAILILSIGTACKKRGAATDTGLGTIRPVPQAAESGWPLYEVPAEGFALTLPAANWRQLDMNPKTFDATINGVLKQNPELGQMVANLRQQLASGCKFFGFDHTTAGTGFTTNVNVIKLSLPPGGSLDSIVADSVTQLENLAAVSKPIAHERIKSPAGDRERLRYRLSLKAPTGQNVPVAITQYILTRDQDGFTVTMSTVPDQEAKYAPTFEKIGNSFRFIKKAP